MPSILGNRERQYYIECGFLIGNNNIIDEPAYYSALNTIHNLFKCVSLYDLRLKHGFRRGNARISNNDVKVRPNGIKNYILILDNIPSGTCDVYFFEIYDAYKSIIQCLNKGKYPQSKDLVNNRNTGYPLRIAEAVHKKLVSVIPTLIR